MDEFFWASNTYRILLDGTEVGSADVMVSGPAPTVGSIVQWEEAVHLHDKTLWPKRRGTVTHLEYDFTEQPIEVLVHVKRV